MTIVYITSENPYMLDNNGGIGTYTKIIAEGMAAWGYKTYLITLGPDECCKSINGVYVIQERRVKSCSKSYANEMELFTQVVTQLAQVQSIDLIECPEWHAPGLLLARAHFPIITRLHTPLFLIEKLSGGKIYRDSYVISDMEREQTALSLGVTSPSTSLAKIVQEAWGIKATVIPNPIVGPIRNGQEGVMRSAPYMLYMGRLEYRKGVFHLAKVLPSILSKYPEMNMVFCGRDTLYRRRSVKKQLCQEISDVVAQVRFVDHSYGQQKNTLISKAEIVICPSVWENFSYVALEAMWAGKIIVASATGGYLEMIEDRKNGFLFDISNPQALEETILYILQNDYK